MSCKDIIIHVNLACLCESCVASLPGSPLALTKNKNGGRAWYRFARDIVARSFCTNYTVLNNLKRHSREDSEVVSVKYSQVSSLLLQLVFHSVAMLDL